MSDHATPNLPARDLAATSTFYCALGFVEGFRDDGWMILKRGDLTLEFYPDPEVDPLTTAAGCCVRLDDLAGFYEICKATGLPETCFGQPRLHPPKTEAWGGQIGALVDIDGNLLRLIQNERSA